MEELKSLLSQKPSEEVWEGICDLLDAVEDEVLLAEMIQVCEEGLAGWPDALRVATENWELGNIRLRLARLRIVFSLPDSLMNDSTIGKFRRSWIIALALHPSRPELCICLDVGYRLQLVIANLETKHAEIIFTTSPIADNEDGLRCEYLSFVDGGGRLLAVFNSDSHSMLTHATILIWEAGKARCLVDPIGFRNEGQVLSKVALCYHAVNRTLYYQFMGEERFHSEDIEGVHTVKDPPIPDIRAIFHGSDNDLVLGFDGGGFVQFDPSKGEKTRNMYHHVVDYSAVQGCVSRDGQIFCSIHPYERAWDDNDSTNPDPLGGIYFWKFGESERLNLLSRYPFKFYLSEYKFLFKALVGSDWITVAVVEKPVSSFPRVTLIDLAGVQRTLELVGISESICINSFDSCDRILLGIEGKVFEWLPAKSMRFQSHE